MIGSLIKSERISKEMKQITLSKGICSSSYLSKIENNQVFPNEEITQLLFQRLGIPLEYMNKRNTKLHTLQQELLKLYGEVLKNRSYSFTKNSLHILSSTENKYLRNGLFYLFNIVKIYILLALKENNSWIKKQLNLLYDYQSEFNSVEAFLFQKCLAIHYLRNNDLDLASRYLHELLNLLSSDKDEYEKADLSQMISTIYLSNNQLLLCIQYADKAIELFNNKVELKRVMEALLIKGIANQREKNFSKATDIYTRTLEIANLINDKSMLDNIFQNLGSVYSALGNLVYSLEFYEKSLAFRNTKEKQLLPIFSIIQVYSKLKDTEMMKRYIDKGFELLNQGTIKNSYYYHFLMYQQLFIRNDGFNLLNEAFEYFESTNDSRHIYKYGIKIGEYLENQRKYRLAASYYKRATNIQNKNINYWEDL